MNPTLIGYFPKQTTPRPEWFKAPVEEICSVSNCIASAPKDWIDLWRHNDFWAFDTPELAWSVVPIESRAEFRIYAYRLFPCRFEGGKQIPIEIQTLNVEPLSDLYIRLGFDAVSRSLNTTYECSPLSCNNMADHRRVNAHCLVDTLEAGIELARSFSIEEPEPGPYDLIEVLRQTPH